MIAKLNFIQISIVIFPHFATYCSAECLLLMFAEMVIVGAFNLLRVCRNEIVVNVMEMLMMMQGSNFMVKLNSVMMSRTSPHAEIVISRDFWGELS
jgi:hypothetical protein